MAVERESNKISADEVFETIKEIEIFRETLVEGQNPNYIIKNKKNNKYLKMNSQEYFIFDLLNNSKNLVQISEAYFIEYHKIAIDYISCFILRLMNAGFIKNYEPKKETKQVLEIKLPLKKLKDIYQYLYCKIGNKILEFYKWKLVLYILFCFTGIVLYFLYKPDIEVSMTKALLISFSIAFIIPMFLHEISHAMMVMHYGREVFDSGFMLYFFMPVFYVNTTDMWMSGRKERVIVDLAGIISDLLCGSLFSIVLWFDISPQVDFICYQNMIITYMRVILNLNPLLKWDGYYVLMDALGCSNLKEEGTSLLKKCCKDIRKVFKLGLKDRVLLGYAVMSSAYICYFMYRLFTIKALKSVKVILNGDLFNVSLSTWFDIFMMILMVIMLVKNLHSACSKAKMWLINHVLIIKKAQRRTKDERV